MKDDICFLCKRNRHAGRLEQHHLFGGARRKLSDRYGLVVILCSECHRTGEHAAHRNADTMQYLHEYGQRKAMQENDWSIDDFRHIFGKNYLEDDNNGTE